MQYSSYGFETILNPRSQCPYTGKESVEKIAEDIKLFACDGSYRFVMYKKGRSVSAIQIMSKDKIHGVVANVITVKSHRRKGYAKRLFNEAKHVIPYISHSNNLSAEGAIFAQKVN